MRARLTPGYCRWGGLDDLQSIHQTKRTPMVVPFRQATSQLRWSPTSGFRTNSLGQRSVSLGRTCAPISEMLRIWHRIEQCPPLKTIRARFSTRRLAFSRRSVESLMSISLSEVRRRRVVQVRQTEAPLKESEYREGRDAQAPKHHRMLNPLSHCVPLH